MMIRPGFVIFVLILFFNFSYAQTKEELKQQRIQNQKDIKYTNELLNTTKKFKKDSYNKVLLLNRKILLRENLIQNIETEISFLINQVDIKQEIVFSLEDDLEELRDEYAQVIYNSFKHRSNYDKLVFILSADSFNKAYKRLKYFQQYALYRKEQIEKIVETKHAIQEEIVEIEILHAEKRDLLIDKRVESSNLVSEKIEQQQDFSRLSKKEKDLKKKLNKQYRVSRNLNKAIERIIEEEARRAAERMNNTDPNFFQLTPEEKLIADVFVKNKNRLPWPTERGIITGKFGEHNHPVFKSVKVRNDGVDISTNEGAIARAVFEGEVSRVVEIPGAHKTVLVRHGNYLTVYSNLKEVIVKQGDKVEIKQTLGVIYTDKEQDLKTTLQFQVWREDVKLNPENWLANTRDG